MKKISQEQIDQLDSVGEKYDCKFYMPPFDSRSNPFYKIDDIKHDAVKFQGFLMEVKATGVKHSFRDLRKRSFMEITGG